MSIWCYFDFDRVQTAWISVSLVECTQPFENGNRFEGSGLTKHKYCRVKIPVALLESRCLLGGGGLGSVRCLSYSTTNLPSHETCRTPLPRSSLTSVTSATYGGIPFKAPHKAIWPAGGLLPDFSGVSVATPDVKSCTNWVRLLLTKVEPNHLFIGRIPNELSWP
jgi:hypothetical protein